MNRTREQWKQADANNLAEFRTTAFHAITNAKAGIEELHRKLSCAEAELIRQTGCTAENVAGIYNLPTPKPIVNARMGESHRLRFQAEDEITRLRAQVAELVKALKKIDECRQIATACKTCDDILQAAIAAAERKEGE